MRSAKSLAQAAALTTLMAMASGNAWAAEELPAVTHDGLELVKKSRLDVVYRRAGVDFGGYSKIMLDPFEVAFKKQWTRDFRSVSESERERIRSEMAAEARRVFVQELQEKGGYEIVDRPAPDVLRVSAAIVELYINAPDAMAAGRNRTYTLSTGDVTLVAELRDSVSGSVVARVADHKRARETPTMQWATKSRNIADAREILRRWARALRDGLDEARGKSN
jgi:hypothetical protein